MKTPNCPWCRQPWPDAPDDRRASVLMPEAELESRIQRLDGLLDQHQWRGEVCSCGWPVNDPNDDYDKATWPEYIHVHLAGLRNFDA